MENYQRQLDEIINNLGEKTPSLLLHACCAPCSSYCLEYLSQYFSITVLFYNPNISPAAEFSKRAEELQRLIAALPAKNKVTAVIDAYDPDEFYRAVKGLENEPERGARCTVCYRMRLSRAAEYAAEHGFDYFCSTLSISPLKDCERLNSIGRELSQLYPVALLPSDFKKKGGYKRSIELSHEYGLYRQNYCGCVFSQKEAEQREKLKSADQ